MAAAVSTKAHSSICQTPRKSCSGVHWAFGSRHNRLRTLDAKVNRWQPHPRKSCRAQAATGDAASAAGAVEDSQASSSKRASEGEFQAWPNGGGSVHTSADVHPSAVIEQGAVVHARASVGPGSRVGSGSAVGPGVAIGDRTDVGYHVSLQHCSIASDCIIHSGVTIGQDGFGFIQDPQGRLIKKPQQAWRVVVEDDVEIGANSCIDRGSWRDTLIQANTKIDNLVQVGHSAVVGRSCLICGHCALGGGSTLGERVVLGGKAAVKDHVSVAASARIAAKAGVVKDISGPGDYAGFPAVAAEEWRRQLATLRKVQLRQKHDEHGHHHHHRERERP